MDSTEAVDIDLSGQLDGPAPEEKKKFDFKRMAFQLSSLQAREWVQRTRDNVKPWAEFLNYNRLRVPKRPGPLGKRLMKNVERFQGNYVFVFIILLVFCILTSPMLIVAIAACLGACYIISVRQQETRLRILGREITLVQQYCVIGVLSFPLFWLAGAGSAVFWVIGASFLIIGLHAGLYAIEEENLFTEVEMQPV